MAFCSSLNTMPFSLSRHNCSCIVLGFWFICLYIKMTRLQFWWDANEFCCCKGTNNHWKSKYFSKKNRVKVDFFDIFIFNNVKLRLKKTFYHPNKVVFKVKMLPLYRLYPYRKPRWAEVGQTYIHLRRNCTLWFWLVRTSQTLWIVKTKQRERLMGCIVYSPHWLRTVIPLVVRRVNYILTLTWGFWRCSFRQSGQCEGLNKWNE